MVKVSYCKNCKKAYRFHFKRRLICHSCKEPFEIMDVKRSKYFIIQLPLLIIGFIFLFYSVFMFSSTTNRLAENFGYFIFGIALVLFALAFQILDSKNMELLAKDKGLKLYGETTDEVASIKDSRKLKTLDFEVNTDKVETRTIKGPKKKITAEDLFTQPNKPVEMHTSRSNSNIFYKPSKNPVKKIAQQSSKQVKLDIVSKGAPEKKRARKIRRAI